MELTTIEIARYDAAMIARRNATTDQEYQQAQNTVNEIMARADSVMTEQELTEFNAWLWSDAVDLPV